MWAVISTVVLGPVILMKLMRNKDNNKDCMDSLIPWPLFNLFGGIHFILDRAKMLLTPPPLFAMDKVTAVFAAKCLYVVTKLEIADHVHEQPMTFQELAKKTGTLPDYLERIIRLCLNNQFFAIDKDGKLVNNRNSAVLRKDHPNSMRGMILHMGDETFFSLVYLDEAIEIKGKGKPTTYTSPFQLAIKDDKKTLWDWLNEPENKERRLIFDQAMVSINSLGVKSVLAEYDFGAFQNIIDVGGGFGSFVLAIKKKHPAINGIVMDLAECVGKAEKLAQSKELTFIAGDFFQSVPRDGDLYILRHIIHDWNDEQSRRILKTVRKAVKDSSKLILIEIVMGTGVMEDKKSNIDIQMMNLIDGKERTKEEFERLAADCEFKLTRVIHTRSIHSILEFIPV